jgi:hypothetical protein
MAETSPGTDRQALHHKPPNPASTQSASTETRSSLESDAASSNSTSTTTTVENHKQSVKKPQTLHTNSKKNSLPFTVCHWNCAKGITNKICDIKLALNELKPSVMFVSEADRASTHDDKLININGYQLHNSKSRDAYGKSRIVAYTKDGSNLIRRHDLESPEAELIIFDKTYQNKPMVDRIIGLYRPFTGPNGDTSSGGAWTRYILLNQAINDCSHATIIGDINVDLLKSDIASGRYAEALKTLCDENSLEQLIHQPTRIQPLNTAGGWTIQESLLDHVYTSDFRTVEKCGSLHLSNSDHMAVYITYQNSDNKSEERKTIYKRDLRMYSKSSMSMLCEAEDWSSVYSTEDVQEGYNIIENKLTNIINTLAPFRKVVISEKHPVSNHALRSLENRRTTLYKKMKSSRTAKSIQDYKLIKKKIKAKVKSIHHAEITKMLKNRNMKCVWQGVNTICGRNTTHTETFALQDPDNKKTVTENKDCANLFAKTFSDKVDKLIEQVGTKDAMVGEIIEKFPPDLDNRSPQFETTDIINVIRHMKNSSSSGHDGISITYIKDCAVQLAPVLKFIYDKVLLFATMPHQWKLAKIIPLHKKDKKDNPENYRPISLLCSLGKVYEKCLLNVMTKKFGDSLPSPFQHGFRKNHSTSTAALTVQNIIAKALDNKKKVIVISTDMSAAFDLLDKEILLPRMQKLGIPSSLCNIYNDFLSNRRAFVQCGESKSEEFDIPVGCVQGSPSGPYLFTLLVDGITEHMSNTSIVAYADDMYFIYEADSWDSVSEMASQNTRKAMEWLKKSGMVLNSSKTEAAYFSTRELTNPPKIEVDGSQIITKPQIKVLGMIFDYKMSWDIHVEKLLKEANSRTQAIRHIQPHLTKLECMNVAHGLFFSKLYYCSCVWLTDMLSKSLMKRVTSSSNACLRAVFGYRIKDISTSDLHKEADILTPFQKASYDKAVMFWRIVNNCEPRELLMDLLLQGSHNIRQKIFHLQQSNMERVGKFSFANRLNDIIPLLSDTWLDESEKLMKRTLKSKILEIVPAKCDGY